MDNKLKAKVLIATAIISVLITCNFFSDYHEKLVPHNSLFYINRSNSPSVFAETAQDIKFSTMVDSIYESKEYSNYIYSQNDLSMAKEYRLYTTDKNKLFEKIYDGENLEKSILIPKEK